MLMLEESQQTKFIQGSETTSDSFWSQIET